MTPRPSPSFSTKRPVSAIFLGSTNSSSSNLPDLPEPPSPGADSNDSGLPSPPATNSTGSGSVGDSAGSVRHRSSSTMLNGNNHTRHLSSASALDDVQDENEMGEDEEQTARFGPGRRYSTSNTPTDNVSALERVKSLAKRNQEALEKLTGMSRINTPSPVNGRSSVMSRSPIPPVSAASSSSSSSSQISHNRAVSHTPSTYRLRDSTRSGSETERESHHSEDHERATTPPATASQRHSRQRLISAPESPSKFRARERERQISPPVQGPRKRASMVNQRAEYEDEDDDVTSAALAAVASSRRSPTGRKARQPLPREFRENDRRSETQYEPTTPHRNRSVKIVEARRSPSPTNTRGSAYNSSTNTPVSPRPVRTILRSSTVRDVSRTKSMRSASDDISSYAQEEDPPEGSRMRRQSLRGGSAESSLANNRSLAGQGLRAAGIFTRRELAEDVFREPVREPDDRRTHSSARGSSVSNDWDDSPDSDRMRLRNPKRSSLTMSRLSEDPNLPYEEELRTPASGSRQTQSRVQSRPATSMAGYHYEDSPDGLRTSTLRAQKSSLTLADRESSSVRPSPRGASQELGYASPYGIQRQLAGTPLSGQRERVTAGDHGRLMMESLSIFESHLSRIPPMGNTTTTTIPELFRSAQSIVQATDRLNHLLRNGTNKALEEQIGAEVSGELGEGNVEMSDYWRGVGSDFRDSLRVSDELVRNMTGFLLGVGKVLRETTTSMGSPGQHMRSMSLDDAAAEIAHTSGGRSSEGRSAAGSRRSWDPVRREPEQRTSSREGVNLSRPPSSFRSRIDETPPTATTQTSNSSSASRRFLTSREREPTANGAPTISSASRRAILDFQESLTLNEPSPTPAPRQHPATTRSTLPPLAVPRPLPLPSNTNLNHQSSDSESSQRKKMSTNSAATVRAGVTFQPTVTTPSATTAITPHTVSFPNLNRADSTHSVQGVAFSRPSTISVSALNGLKHRESRGRIASNSDFSSSEDQPNPPQSKHVQLNSPISATDRDKEQRWRTVGPRTVRVSVDGAANGDNGYDPAESQTMRLPSSSRRERRRTITEIFAGS